MRHMLFSRTSILLLLLVNTGGAGEPDPPVLHLGEVPIGWLGYPLGTYLTVEGHRVEAFKAGAQTLRVDTVNGKKLDNPIGIWIDNMDLPADTRCILKGYESMRMIGAPPASEQAAKEAGKPFRPPQAGWQVQCYFVTIKVLNHLRPDPVAAIRAALPKDWTIVRVQNDTSPSYRPKGKGKAIFLLSPNHTGGKQEEDAVIYIMPPGYDDGGEDPTHGEAQTSPARLFVATPDARVYVWPSAQLTGWPTSAEDLLKALLE